MTQLLPKNVGAVKTPNYRFSPLNVEFLYSWTTYIGVTLLPHKVFLQFYILLQS
jgi:hypothetical protein